MYVLIIKLLSHYKHFSAPWLVSWNTSVSALQLKYSFLRLDNTNCCIYLIGPLLMGIEDLSLFLNLCPSEFYVVAEKEM